MKPLYSKHIRLFLMFVSFFVFVGCDKKHTTKADETTSEGTYENVTAEEANILIEQNKDYPDFSILDVRTPDEFTRGHIAGAQNLDFYNSDFDFNLEQLNKTKTYFIYCASDNRSGKAIKKMKSTGFKTVYNLVGGINSWIKAGYPVIIS